MDLAQLNNPLMAGVAGLSIGLVLTFFVMVKAWFGRRSLEKENASLLRGHILMHDTGHKTLSAELGSVLNHAHSDMPYAIEVE